MRPTVLISGASIAGPALAHWLHRYGFRPVVVERAASIRGGGYPIDIRATALDVVERMGVLPQLRAAHIDTRQVTFVDARDRATARLTPDEATGSPTGRDIEIPRGDLTALLYARTRDDVEYVFDDSITRLAPHAGGVDVAFRRGRPRTVDLVVGADGLHSTVRRLAFGPEREFRRDLGYYFAGFSIDDDRELDREVVLHNTPGRLAGLYAVRGQEKVNGVLAFASRTEQRFDPADVDQQREIVARAFAGGGWDIPRMLTAMRSADDFFFDTVSQIRMPRWTSGRVALTGDAAHAPALLSGQGTSLALIGAYVLAGELAEARGDHQVAFPAYERALRGFVERNQRIARTGGAAMIPPTRVRIWLRDRLAAAHPHLGPAKRLVAGQVDRAARGFSLRDHRPLPVPQDAVQETTS